MGKVGIVELIYSGVSLSLIVMFSALPYWVQYEQPGEVTTLGLWMSCSKGDDKKEAVCREASYVQEYLLAVRAFVLMGLLLVISATVLLFIRIFVIKENTKISLFTGTISIAAGICMLIGAIVYTGRSSYLAKGDPVYYHVGFALAIIAGVVGEVAGILSICGKAD